MPANSANLNRPFHSTVYDKNLGLSLQRLWAAARDNYVDAATGEPKPVPYWSGLSREGEQLDPTGLSMDKDAMFVADDELARTAKSIRELDEAVTRRQYVPHLIRHLPQLSSPTPILHPPSSLAQLEPTSLHRDTPSLAHRDTSPLAHLDMCPTTCKVRLRERRRLLRRRI